MSFATQIKNIATQAVMEFQGLTYGKIIAFDETEYQADVEILKTRSVNGNPVQFPNAYNLPIINTIGAGLTTKTLFTSGDIVIIAFSTSEIDPTGKPSADNSKLLSRDNAVILGSLLSQNSPTEIKFTVGTTVLKIDSTGAHLTVGGVSINLFTHLHGTGIGPSSPPTPGT